jgi:hypothetical protein
MESPGLVPLLAPVAEVGRFFANHHVDGRLSARTKSTPPVIIGRQGSSLAVIERRDDLVVAAMMTLPPGAPPGLGDDLRGSLDRAVDSLSRVPSAPSKRKSAPR